MRPGQVQYEEVGVMVKCRNCGMELGPEQTCVFATYKSEMDGKELMVCCERCAGHLEEAPPPEAAPIHPVAGQTAQVILSPVRKAARKAPRPAKKARRRPARKVMKKRPGRKTTRKHPSRKTTRTRSTRKPVKKAAPRRRRK
jgi:hypothetical protein